MENLTIQKVFFILLTSFVSIISIQITQTKGEEPAKFDLYDYFKITKHPDGSISRDEKFHPAAPPNASANAFSKDVTLNPANKMWVRLYLPTKPDIKNLPIIVFAHGGMFMDGSSATPVINTYLENTAKELNVLVISVDYRMAPEYRLPAAYDDVMETLRWIKDKKDEWVQKYADVSKVLLMGESVGGNIAYIVGLQASNITSELNPLAIQGLVLLEPFFGSIKDETNVPPMMDVVWRAALPVGAKLDNPYFNPMFDGGSKNLDTIKGLGWRILVTSYDGDMLYGMQQEVYKFLQTKGLNVSGDFGKGFYHGVLINNDQVALRSYQAIRKTFSPIFG